MPTVARRQADNAIAGSVRRRGRADDAVLAGKLAPGRVQGPAGVHVLLAPRTGQALDGRAVDAAVDDGHGRIPGHGAADDGAGPQPQGVGHGLDPLAAHGHAADLGFEPQRLPIDAGGVHFEGQVEDAVTHGHGVGSRRADQVEAAGVGIEAKGHVAAAGDGLAVLFEDTLVGEGRGHDVAGGDLAGGRDGSWILLGGRLPRRLAAPLGVPNSDDGQHNGHRQSQAHKHFVVLH